jgi:hypothetical protein
MPVTPAVPYPTVANVMNRARAIVNDSYQGGAGRILTNAAAFTAQYLNGALEELQDRLRNNTVITFTRDNVIIGPLPPLAGPAPGQQVMLAYTGFFVNGAWLPTPVLPSDCVAIEKVWERAAGSNTPFAPMTQPMEGLPSVYQGPWQRMWEYRQDMLVMPGSTTTEELRLRYQMQMASIPNDSTNSQGDDSWNNITINILASTNALATLVAYNYARARGAQAAATMAADAEKFIRLILNRYIRRAQSIRYNRKPFGSTNLSNRSGGNLPW